MEIKEEIKVMEETINAYIQVAEEGGFTRATSWHRNLACDILDLIIKKRKLERKVIMNELPKV